MNTTQVEPLRFTDEHYIAFGRMVVEFQFLEQVIFYSDRDQVRKDQIGGNARVAEEVATGPQASIGGGRGAKRTHSFAMANGPHLWSSRNGASNEVSCRAEANMRRYEVCRACRYSCISFEDRRSSPLHLEGDTTPTCVYEKSGASVTWKAATL